MKFKLHRPKQGVWQVALLLFILSMIGAVIGIPFLSAWAFPLMALSAALLLLGTWVF